MTGVTPSTSSHPLFLDKLIAFAFLSLSLLISSPDPLFAADSTKSTSSFAHYIHRDASILFQDAATFFTSPLRFSDREWLCAGAALGGTVALYLVDEPVRRSVGREGQTSTAGGAWEIPTRYGDLLYAGGLTATIYVLGAATRNEELQVTGRMLGESIVLAGVPVLFLKFATGRSRPYTDEGSGWFNGFGTSNEKQAFPSGHSAVAFAVSTVLAERIDNTWARIGLYGLATWTAYSRVYTDQHWLSDVVVASGIGLAAGLFVARKENERGSSPKSSNESLILVPSIRGVTLVYRF